jgi:hypothetical protein
MAILNITYSGRNAEFPVSSVANVTDDDLRRIAVELVRSSGLAGLELPQLPRNAFESFVVDRLTAANGEKRVYLRPKVPFGDRRSA